MTFEDPLSEIYNLGFGDYNSTKKTMDDLVVTDNKDAQKVLLTVASAVLNFTDKYPNSLVLLREARHREHAIMSWESQQT